MLHIEQGLVSVQKSALYSFDSSKDLHQGAGSHCVIHLEGE